MTDKLLFWVCFQWLVFCDAISWPIVIYSLLWGILIFGAYKCLVWLSNGDDGRGPPCAA